MRTNRYRKQPKAGGSLFVTRVRSLTATCAAEPGTDKSSKGKHFPTLEQKDFCKLFYSKE